MDYLSLLPYDLIYRICNYIELEDFNKLIKLSKYFEKSVEYDIINNKIIYKCYDLKTYIFNLDDFEAHSHRFRYLYNFSAADPLHAKLNEKINIYNFYELKTLTIDIPKPSNRYPFVFKVEDFKEFKLNEVFPNLLEYNIRSLIDDFDSVSWLLKDFPKLLKKFSTNIYFTNRNTLILLPLSVESLEIVFSSNVQHYYELFYIFPDHLKTLILTNTAKKSKHYSNFFKMLPKSLTSLKFVSIEEASDIINTFSTLIESRKIKELALIKTIRSNIKLLYPSNIESLRIERCSNISDHILPINLIHLTINNYFKKSTSKPKLYLPKLPETLICLIITNSEILKLPKLPQKLVYLSLISNKFDISVHQVLPSGLKKLKLIYNSYADYNDIILYNFSNFELLTELSIDYTNKIIMPESLHYLTYYGRPTYDSESWSAAFKPNDLNIIKELIQLDEKVNYIKMRVLELKSEDFVINYNME